MKNLSIKISELKIPTDWNESTGDLTINEFLNGDLDMDLFNTFDIDLGWDDEHLWINGNTLTLIRTIAILNGIAKLNEDTHMLAYKEIDKFHDGGDDFDYGQSYLLMLAEILELNINNFQ